MTKAKLIKALKNLKVQTGSLACLGCGREHNCGTHGCAIIRAAVEELEKMQWVSVKDRIPQITGKYICSVKDTNGYLWTVCATFAVGINLWFGDFGEIQNEVTHWMPLPEPIEKKEREENAD